MNLEKKFTVLVSFLSSNKIHLTKRESVPKRLQRGSSCSGSTSMFFSIMFPAIFVFSRYINSSVLLSTSTYHKGHSQHDQMLRFRSLQELWAVSVLPAGTNSTCQQTEEQLYREQQQVQAVDFLPFQLVLSLSTFKLHKHPPDSGSTQAGVSISTCLKQRSGNIG